MEGVPAGALAGDGVFTEPRRLLRAHRLGDPGDEIVAVDDDETVTARLADVQEVRLTHLDLDPAQRERLCSGTDTCETVFVHELDDVTIQNDDPTVGEASE